MLAILRIRNFGPIPLFYLVFLYAMYNEHFESIRASLERFIIDHPVAFIAPSLAVLITTWRMLGNRSLSRKLCTMNLLLQAYVLVFLLNGMTLRQIS